MIKDPNGLCWFPMTKKRYTHQEALEYAASIGLRLPTKEEIEAAIDSKFNLGEVYFWSSSVHPDYSDFAFYFDYSYGLVNGYRVSATSVRCVASEKELHDREFNRNLEGLLNTMNQDPINPGKIIQTSATPEMSFKVYQYMIQWFKEKK